MGPNCPPPILIAMSTDRESRSMALTERVAAPKAQDEIVGMPVASALGLLDVSRSSSATRLLLVEDNPSDAALPPASLRSTALSELCEIVLVGRLSECVLALADEMPACVLLDMGLPDAQGIEGIARIRIVAPDVPVVVLTGNDDDTMGLDALQCGAQDYLVKGHVDGRVLARSIRYAIERMRGDQRIHFLAFHDSLTELANRALFADRLQVALTRSRPRSPLLQDAITSPATPAVLVIDLDYFKLVNDSLGHASGDVVLRAVAQRLQAVVRPSDTVARLGGDEFAVLCEGISADQVSRVAQRVVDVLSAPIAFDGMEAYVGASIGIAIGPVGSTDGDGLIRDADIAMYRAKGEGRGRFVLFEEEMRTVVQVHHATSTALPPAL